MMKINDENKIFDDKKNIDSMSNNEMQIRDNYNAHEQMKQSPFTNKCFMRLSLNASFLDIESFVSAIHGANSENFEA